MNIDNGENSVSRWKKYLPLCIKFSQVFAYVFLFKE